MILTETRKGQGRKTAAGMVRPGQVDLLVVDEADRLKPLALEVLRAVSDRSPIGLILVGMKGAEKRLVRYPQLYSRVGFVHQYRTRDARRTAGAD